MSQGLKGRNEAHRGTSAFLSHAPCVVTCIVADDAGLRLTWVDGNAVGLIGIGASALIGNAAPLLALIDEEPDRAAVRDGLHRVIADAHRFERLIWLRGRPLRLAAQSGPPVDGLPSAVAVITDASAEAAERTERASAEMRFRKAFMAAPGLFAISTPDDGRHIDVNDLWLRTMEWRREDVIGRTAAELGVWADPTDRARIVAALQTQGSVRDFETRFRTRTGQVREFLVAGELIDLDGGRRLLLVAHDMTDRNAALRALASLNAELEARVERRTAALRDEVARREEIENALRSAKDAAETANRAKSAFLSSMSHELRTPMNAILGFAQLMRAIEPETLTPRNDEYIGHILSAGHHLLSLIDDVLDLSKIETGRTTLSLEPIAIGEVFDHVVSILAPTASRFGVTIHPPEQAPEQTPADLRVLADSVRLGQVLINLGSNAAKYNRPGGWMTFSATAAPGREGFVRIVVSDNGRGIPEHRLPEVFQPFNRLGAESGPIEGTGIGLAIARNLVEMMGGNISVDSTLGHGTTFTIDLPRADTQTPPLRSIAGHAGTPAGEPSPGRILAEGQWTVLYIEDVSANVRLMAGVLSPYPGVRLLSAPTLDNGLELARTHRPDLIVTDINLAGGDGFAVLESLRACGELSGIPVIALTARATPHERQRGLRAGFAAYLGKPLDVAGFLAEVDAILAAPAEERRGLSFPQPEPEPAD